MVLPGYALMAQGTRIHVAAWPGREVSGAPPPPVSAWARQLLLSRTFGSQAGCYVLAVGGLRVREHLSERYRDLCRFDYTGDSYIIDPRGEIIAGPAKGEVILTARGSLEAVYAAKVACDVGGHCSRPDIFQLHMNGQPLERLVMSERSEPPGSAAENPEGPTFPESPIPGPGYAKESVDGNRSEGAMLTETVIFGRRGLCTWDGWH